MTCLPSVFARGVVSRYRGLCTQAPVSVAPALFTRLPFAGDGSLIMDSLQTLESARAAVPMETAAEAGLAAETHRPRRSRRRRLVEYAVLAVVWIGLGLVLSLGLVPFLLLGAPLLVLFQLVRRQPLRRLWSRDADAFARGWAGKLLVAAVLVVLPTVMLLQSLRLDRYANDSWTALVMAAVLAGGYLATRRLVLTVTVAALAVVVTSWMLTPDLATARNGDPVVLAHLEEQHSMGMLYGFKDIAVAEIDLDAADPVRLAGFGATATTPMEVGSVTKAMTGLVIADAVSRGEVRMDVPVSTYLPQLTGSPAGLVTLHELVTHTAGYANFGAVTLRRGFWSAPLGRNFLGTDTEQMTQELRGQNLASRGSWKYSSLGAASCGAGRRRSCRDELLRSHAHPPVRAARHDRYHHPGRRRPRHRWAVADRAPGSSRGRSTHTPRPAPLSPLPQTSRSSPPHCWRAPHPAWPRWTRPLRLSRQDTA